jgi:xanthine/uracil permease
MRFWIRELAGWLLVCAGLFCFFLAYLFCAQRWVFPAWPPTIFGIVVFRGGIHLLKVAVAARVCLQAQDRLYPAPVLRLRAPASRRGSGVPRGE